MRSHCSAPGRQPPGSAGGARRDTSPVVLHLPRLSADENDVKQPLGALFLLCGLLLAGDQSPSTAPDLSALGIESLLNIKVITASKFAEKLADAPGVMSVVTRDELQRFGGVTLKEILERVAGLSGNSGYFTERSVIAALGDQIKVSGGHVLFLINGRPTREILEG